jgi:hypothetical protein
MAGKVRMLAGSARVRIRRSLIASCLEASALTVVPSSAAHSGPETGDRPRAGLARLDLTVARRRVGNEGSKQLVRRFGDLVDRPSERGLVGLRGPGEAAELADELQGGRADLLVRGRRLEVVQGPDVATHEKPRNGGKKSIGARPMPCPRSATSDAMPAFSKRSHRPPLRSSEGASPLRPVRYGRRERARAGAVRSSTGGAPPGPAGGG